MRMPLPFLLLAAACAAPSPAAVPAGEKLADTAPGDTGSGIAPAGETTATDSALPVELDAAPDDSAAGQGIPLDQLLEAWLEAACNPAACLQNGISAGFLDPAACKAFLGDAETAGLLALVAKAKSGKLLYDPVQAAACIAAQAKRCRFALVPAPSPQPCQAMFTGSGKPGSACTSDDDCASDWCDRSQAKADHCPGVCAVRASLGSKCKQPEACQAGLACIDSTCRTDKPRGLEDACGELACKSGLWCDASAKKPVCKKQLAVGKVCQDGASCVEGATCFFAEDGPSLCQPLANKGEPCSGYDPIVGPGGGCVAGLVCANLDPAGRTPKNRCLPLVPLGGTCQVQAQCGAKDLVCKGAADGKPGVCAPVPKQGEACTKSVLCCGAGLGCFPGTACDPVAGKCVPSPGKGKPCVGGLCAGQYTCVDGTCDGPGGTGEACSDLAPCSIGHDCKAGKCTLVPCA